MKFYEVGPNLSLTQHAITIRPVCFSGKTFKKLPPDLQAAIVKAGKEAGAYGRQLESGEDAKKLEAMAKAGKLKLIKFTDHAQLSLTVNNLMDKKPPVDPTYTSYPYYDISWFDTQGRSFFLEFTWKLGGKPL